MEDAVWRMVLELLPPDQLPDGRFRYSDRRMLMVTLWAIMCDRPFSWACRAEHWPTRWRPEALPDQSTLSRRLQRPRFRAALDDVLRRSQEAFGQIGREVFIDGRPLLIGGAGKDRDARKGRAVGGFGRGYKLHALTNGANVFVALIIRPLNENEARVGLALLATAPGGFRRVIGDGEYDTMRMHRAARQRGARLYAMPRQRRVGRRAQPERLHALRVLSTAAGEALLRQRSAIERTFGDMSNLAIGFKGLPAWVRGLRRVDTWVKGKVLLYHCHLLAKRRARKCA